VLLAQSRDLLACSTDAAFDCAYRQIKRVGEMSVGAVLVHEDQQQAAVPVRQCLKVVIAEISVSGPCH
jgi:hypothetical protein